MLVTFDKKFHHFLVHAVLLMLLVLSNQDCVGMHRHPIIIPFWVLSRAINVHVQLFQGRMMTRCNLSISCYLDDNYVKVYVVYIKVKELISILTAAIRFRMSDVSKLGYVEHQIVLCLIKQSILFYYTIMIPSTKLGLFHLANRIELVEFCVL